MASEADKKILEDAWTFTSNFGVAMEFLIDAVGKPRFEVQQLVYLIAVASVPGKGKSMTEIAEAMGTNHSFVSRNTKLFSAQTMEKPFVEYRIDYENPKYRLVSFTEHGHKVMRDLYTVIHGGAKWDKATGKLTLNAKGKQLQKAFDNVEPLD